MSDPIERQVAIVALRESRLARNPVYMTTAMQVIEKLPPAQPERKKGKWIEDHCSDYRGNIGIPLYNDSDEVQVVERQERIAQIIFMQVPDTLLYEVMGDLSYTQRGEAGFGSTGR